MVLSRAAVCLLMISVTDFIHLPFTPDLTEGGIAYTCRALPHAYGRRARLPFERLRRIVAGVAVELAFRRYLVQQNISFGVKEAMPFSDPDRYDVSLGGHRCEIRSFLISRRNQIASLRSDPGLALDAPALVPMDHYHADGQSPDDLYLFAFLTGLVAASVQDFQRASVAGQPHYLMHTMPRTWSRPQSWIPLGPLALKSEADQLVTLEIGGEDFHREFLMLSVQLPPRTRVGFEADFHSLAYMHAKSKPTGRLGIYSPARAETHLVEASEWGNIWIYGLDIYLAGWITREEFRRRATLLAEGTRVYQYSQTRTRNLAVSMADLRPLMELLDRVRKSGGSTRPD